MKIERFGEQGREERGVLERKGCQNPPVWVEKEQEKKNSPTSPVPQREIWGCRRAFGELWAPRGAGDGAMQGQVSPHRDKNLPGTPQGVTAAPRGFGMGFGRFFFPAIPSGHPQREAEPCRGKKAAQATTWFSLFPSWDRSENSPQKLLLHGKPFCLGGKEKTKQNDKINPPLPTALSPCADDRNLSRRKRERLGMSLVPIQLHGKSTGNPPPRGPAGIKNWMQEDVQSVLITKHSKASWITTRRGRGGRGVALPCSVRTRGSSNKAEKTRKLFIIIYFIYIFISPPSQGMLQRVPKSPCRRPCLLFFFGAPISPKSLFFLCNVLNNLSQESAAARISLKLNPKTKRKELYRKICTRNIYTWSNQPYTNIIYRYLYIKKPHLCHPTHI